jgi:arylsulfatase A-like enzyme
MAFSSSAKRFACGAAAVAFGVTAWLGQRPPHVTGIVIITLDTVRADRLPPYGFTRVVTPALSTLAARGVVFEHASTVAPLTLPAHSSLFTGRYPAAHGVHDNADALSDRMPTLASALQRRGFRTAAVVGSVVLSADRGLARGFQTYRDDLAGGPQHRLRRQRPGNEVADEAIAWLDTVGREPFLLWVHLYDAHLPYEPPEPFASTYRDDPYLGEIAFADTQIQRVVQTLYARGLSRRTAVVVAADHGESLGDHGEDAHGLLIYESVLHVPLIVCAPGVAPARVDAPVTVVDLMPTVLDLTGTPPEPGDGVSLEPSLRGKRVPERSIYAESFFPRRFGWSELRSIHDGRFKFIEAPRPELYDLQRDPLEQQNVYDDRPAVARSLAATLTPIAPRIGRRAVDAALAERLASLGYMSGRDGAPRAPLPDPKDRVAIYNDSIRRSTCHGGCELQR